ncbi:MAG: pilus assembly FimT family protein [Dyella sp.]|uniref:pilus assembly FimT family protein n=1 Tax=Dyella sp. TaxID=1869338 RepID=UPI003F7E991A
MITIGMLAFLVTLGVPLLRTWLQSAHQREAAGLLSEALGRAKSLALRNRQASADQTLPAAAVCFAGGKLAVVASKPQGATCDAKAEWARPVPADASIVLTLTNIPFQCVAYNTHGVALVTTVSNLSCSQAALDVNVASGEAFNVPLP